MPVAPDASTEADAPPPPQPKSLFTAITPSAATIAPTAHRSSCRRRSLRYCSVDINGCPVSGLVGGMALRKPTISPACLCALVRAIVSVMRWLWGRRLVGFLFIVLTRELSQSFEQPER